jgi:putative transposase
MFTRRCAHRQYLLRPSKKVNQALVYCYAVAAQNRSMAVYWLLAMSNHEHDGAKDQEGEYPRFLREFHSLLARCLNVHLGRWEGLWADEQPGALHLGDAEAIFDKMIYSLTNPVQAHLVDKALNWPGFSSLPYQLSGKPVVVKRPNWFFDPDGEMPEEVELRFERPPEFAHLSHQEWTDKIRAAVAEVERKAAEERQRTGRKIVGRKAILRQSPFSCPKSCTRRRGLRPRLAARNKWRRIELLSRCKQFVAAYRKALAAWRAGATDVLFPHGTYQMARLHPIQCEPPPAPS